MNRNIMRYNKGGLMLDFENQKNHYKHLLHPRKSMQISQDSNRDISVNLSQTNKYEKHLNKISDSENQRLFKILLGIRNGKGVIQQMSERAKLQEKSKKKSTLYNQFKQQQKKKQMQKENQLMVKKIWKAQSKIGNSVQWKNHYQKYEKQKRKISKASKNVFDAQTLFTQTNSEFKGTNFRETIDFFLTRTSKSQSRKNKTVRKLRKRQNFDKQQQNFQTLNSKNVNQEQQSLQADRKQLKKLFARQFLLSSENEGTHQRSPEKEKIILQKL